jgi:hypothetical protein
LVGRGSISQEESFHVSSSWYIGLNEVANGGRREFFDGGGRGEGGGHAMLIEDSGEASHVSESISVRRVGTVDDLRCLDEELESPPTTTPTWYSELLVPHS